MKTNKRIWSVSLFLLLNVFFVSSCHALAARTDRAKALNECHSAGWESESFFADGYKRSLLWKAPVGRWAKGSIIVLHGGGGSHYHFCFGGRLVQPQIDFANRAVRQGFAVFLLDSTNDIVTDASGRKCGKRFDFSVLNRPNIDLPYIEKVIKKIIPHKRPRRSSNKIFITGLSTGGYMTIRAATHFDKFITAFAPVSAGDPYGTETNCDSSLSPRKSAKGILTDLETGKQITKRNACLAAFYPNEKVWQTGYPLQKPAFKQFHNAGDAIVDISCMQKARKLLNRHGYRDKGALILRTNDRKPLFHLWLKRYNQPILDFFKSQ